MRYLGLDLGTSTCGVSITDRANILVHPYKLIKFNHEDYNSCLNEIKKIIEEESITCIAIGLPKNMDGSEGFASQRTYNFINMLTNLGIEVNTVDERLTTVEAHRLLHDANLKEKKHKKIVDMQSAVIILETYLRSIK